MRRILWIAFCLALFASGPDAAIAQPKPENDLDAFMAKVLQRRADTWRQLQDYILDESERFAILGPGDVRLFGQQRLYSWYVRDGYLIRSPVKFNGVTLSDADRRKYENDWLSEEKDRERQRIDRRNARARRETQATQTPGAAATPFDPGVPVQTGIDDLVKQGVEPRFISESYFLQFTFEPGNYYLVGRERLENREVLHVEYYPRKRMWDGMDENENENRDKPDTPDKPDKPDQTEPDNRDTGGKKSDRERRMQRDFERKFNKVALVTLWIDPQEHQIVKYTFDNVDFGFLPGRWAVRADQLTASMSTSQPFPGIWLPRDMAVEGGFTLATGSYRVRYTREFHDYKQSDVRAKIRGYEREP